MVMTKGAMEKSLHERVGDGLKRRRENGEQRWRLGGEGEHGLQLVAGTVDGAHRDVVGPYFHDENARAGGDAAHELAGCKQQVDRDEQSYDGGLPDLWTGFSLFTKKSTGLSEVARCFC